MLSILKFFAMFFMLIVFNAHAESLWENIINGPERIFDNPDRIDFLVPVYTWHNRFLYNKEFIPRYNEKPWGYGVGLSHTEGDIFYKLMAIAFLDSHSDMQGVLAYSLSKRWGGTWYFDAGLVLTLQVRKDYSYIPIPLPLPVAEIGHENFALQLSYVPAGRNDGNVLFFVAKFSADIN